MLGTGDPKYSFYQLPATLEVALRKFGDWSDGQLKIEQAHIRRTSPLFHYTSFDNFEKIIRSQSLWCFAHFRQNDQEEFDYSLAVARAELKRIYAAGQYQGYFSACAEDLISKNVLTDVFNFFLFSVSEHRDSVVLNPCAQVVVSNFVLIRVA